MGHPRAPNLRTSHSLERPFFSFPRNPQAAADPRIVDPFPSAQRLYGMQVEKALKEAGEGAGGSSTQERTNHIGRSGLYLHAPNRRR